MPFNPGTHSSSCDTVNRWRLSPTAVGAAGTLLWAARTMGNTLGECLSSFTDCTLKPKAGS